MSNAEVFLFQMLKGGVDRRTRDMMGASIAQTIRRSWPLPPTELSVEEADVVQRLHHTGFAMTKPMFSTAELNEIDAYLVDKPMWFGDVDMFEKVNEPRTLLGSQPPGRRFGFWPQDVISGCAPFCRAVHDPALLRVAEAYLGAPPTVTLLTAWWSFPSSAARGGMQNFHHDRDDFRMLKVFVYLTDTTAASGPHEFVEETHSFEALMGVMKRRGASESQEHQRFLNWMEEHRKEDDDVARNLPKENIRTVVGARGSTFFEDTRGLHRGVPPRDAPRLAFEICYSLARKFNVTYEPIPRPGMVAGRDLAATYASRLFYKDP